MVRAAIAGIAGIGLAALCGACAHAAELPRRSVDKAGRAAWRAALHWSDDCEQGFAYGDETGGVAVMEVAPQRSVVEVVCALGAYQGWQHYFLFDETHEPPTARLLSLRVYGEDGFSDSAEIWGRSELDPARHELVVTNVFRGIGDCGVRSKYRFAKDALELVEVRAQLACEDDPEPVEPEQWPIVKVP
jgi:hypothetical protein